MGLLCRWPNGLELTARQLRDPSLSIDSFRRQLKTFLFADYSVHSALEFFVVDALYKSTFTYLLTEGEGEKGRLPVKFQLRIYHCTEKRDRYQGRI